MEWTETNDFFDYTEAVARKIIELIKTTSPILAKCDNRHVFECVLDLNEIKYTDNQTTAKVLGCTVYYNEDGGDELPVCSTISAPGLKIPLHGIR